MPPIILVIGTKISDLRPALPKVTVGMRQVSRTIAALDKRLGKLKPVSG